MPQDLSPGKPTARRSTPAEKERAVRAVRQLRKQLGTEHGTIQRVADRLGIGTESLRARVRRADIDDGAAYGRADGPHLDVDEVRWLVSQKVQQLGSAPIRQDVPVLAESFAVKALIQSSTLTRSM
jgi:transposase-like protein